MMRAGNIECLEGHLDDVVGLQGGEGDVEEPEEDQEGDAADAGPEGSTELSLAEHVQVAAHHQQHDGQQGHHGVDDHAEAQCARRHHEDAALGRVVQGGDHPRQAQTEEHVHGVAAGDVADGVVGVLLLHGGSLAGERVRQRRAHRHQSDSCTQTK